MDSQLTVNNEQLTKVVPANRRPVLGFIGLLVLVALVNIFLIFQPAQAVVLPTEDEQKLIHLTNKARTDKGLPSLVYNSQLTEAARLKAEDMLQRGYFDHVTPTGETPWYFVKRAGYDYTKAGENLAIDFATVEEVVPAWLASPAHRANMLKVNYEEIGIAVVKGTFKGRETTVVVQLFGKKF